MIRVVTVADIHVRVDNPVIGISWNHQRLSLLVDSINELDVDEVWIIGDLFDRSLPNMSDIMSAHHFISKIEKPIKFLEGNHERISRDIYTLNALKAVLDITKLPESFDMEGVSVTAIGHDVIHKIKDLPKSDLLLSHFRWSHDVFGVGELNSKTEKLITKNFGLTILGDIHYPYEPVDNVKYISSPYAINYGTPKDYGLGIITFDKGSYKFERVKLDLPCKISAKLNLSLVNGYIASTKPKHLYRIVVMLRYNQLEDFKKLKTPANVDLMPKFEETKTSYKEPEKIEVGANIKDVLLSSLKLPEQSDIEYIKETLKEN